MLLCFGLRVEVFAEQQLLISLCIGVRHQPPRRSQTDRSEEQQDYKRYFCCHTVPTHTGTSVFGA
jgi:hypothetical protein